MYPVAWSDLSWEAFATLVTGALAVIAALLVGLRQMKLMEGQSKLQEQQLRLEAFDRRMAVFEEVEKFVNSVLVHGRPVEAGQERPFLIAKMNARFLFSKTVNEFLQEIWRRHCDYHAVHTVMTHNYKIEGTYGEENVHKGSEHLKWFSETSSALESIFSEMKPLN